MAKKIVKKVVAKVAGPVKIKDAVRKIQRQSNGSCTLALPAEMLRALGWKDKQKLSVKLKGDTLVVLDWKPKK